MIGRRLLLVLLALVPASCDAPPKAGADGSVASIDADPGLIAALGAGIPPDLTLRGQAELSWQDGDGTNHKDKVDVKLWLRGDEAMACDLGVLGSRIAWAGRSGDRWWLFEKLDTGMALTRGTAADLSPSHPIGVLLSPGSIRIALGMSGDLAPPDGSRQNRWMWRSSADGKRITGVTAIGPSGASLWKSSWTGTVPIGPQGSGGPCVPARIDLERADGSSRLTLWIGSVAAEGGRDAFFDLDALRASLKPTIEREAGKE
ncbi:MAG: hypothetical protein O2819_01540 [Planctomycetota bacterium]|nr:hypothetical protein [Planctomycetota bacterium]MDA1105032.1 hypothetical protein [Planctomycetota bacterium]